MSTLQQNKSEKTGPFAVFHKVTGKLVDIISILSFVFMTIFTLLNALYRFAPNFLPFAYTWGEEASRYLMIAGLMLGISIGVRNNSHQGVESIVKMFPKALQNMIHAAANILTSATYVVMAVLCMQFVYSTMYFGQTSPSLKAPMALIYFLLFLGFVLAVLENLVLFYRIFIKKELEATEGKEAGVL
ncbi:MAG: TRAP transporter small permease subunit [Clostridia bacterium]|nr:TRAP transporter small permease subunit [Clostridia bacterium]